MKFFFFKESVVSYVFYTLISGKILKILARTVFTQIENLCMERVKPGRFIDK